MVIVAADGSELHTHTVATGCFVDFGTRGRLGDLHDHRRDWPIRRRDRQREINAYVADLSLTSTWAGTIAC